jgi:hypothetical protein
LALGADGTDWLRGGLQDDTGQKLMAIGRNRFGKMWNREQYHSSQKEFCPVIGDLSKSHHQSREKGRSISSHPDSLDARIATTGTFREPAVANASR